MLICTFTYCLDIADIAVACFKLQVNHQVTHGHAVQEEYRCVEHVHASGHICTLLSFSSLQSD
jgi:hypothetical protein